MDQGPRGPHLGCQEGITWIGGADIEDVPGAIDVYRDILDIDVGHPAARGSLEVHLRSDDKQKLLVANILEPVYEQLQEWGPLVGVHEIQLAAEKDTLRRVSLLLRIGELQRTKLMDAATDVLEVRHKVEAAATAAGLHAPAALREAFEDDDGFDDAIAEGGAELQAIEHYTTAVDQRPDETTPLMQLGLLGQTPDADLERARAAFGRGDLAASAQASDAGLIDEYRAMVYPVLVGGGTPFFPRNEHRLDLELVETRAFGGKVVHLRHRVVR